ncbi:MAG TPA: thermonuclease family protein [Planctomycetota bacterium]|nr:thermonuclease family protein [Planctomycetota bacterium]
MQLQLFLACVLLALPGLPQAPVAAPAAAPATTVAAYPPGIPKELYEVDKVVDGDTIYVVVRDKVTKLRLLCVDTEEKLSVNAGSASKPGTVFGEECAKWAQDFFAAQARDGKKPRVGLYFPAGREQLDSYGRTLCHVILQDGRDFNLLLVEEGKSPYFNKYGNSPVAHELFAAAQERARAAQKGIWNPATNVPKTEGAPSARRPYELLIPWWNARAAAIDDFRERERKDPRGVADAENPASLRAAAEQGGEVDVFGTVDKTFDEENGDWTLLLRCEDKDGAVRVRIGKEQRALFSKLDLAHLNAEDRQNYLWARGKLGKGARGLELAIHDAAQLRIAKPEPVLPKPVPAGH